MHRLAATPPTDGLANRISKINTSLLDRDEIKLLFFFSIKLMLFYEYFIVSKTLVKQRKFFIKQSENRHFIIE